MKNDSNQIIRQKSRRISRGTTNIQLHEFYVNNPEKNACYKHINNSVSTTKYNILTFLPKGLLFQFTRLANCYFLIIAILQSIPLISPLSSSTAIAPLAFVLTVSLIREGIEDYARYRYDKKMNKELVQVFRDGKFVDATSASLRVGEVIIVQENHSLPADTILLDSNLKEGNAYIETATLDGEKTWKMKIANKETSSFFNNGGLWKDTFIIGGKCECDLPHPDLYKLEGNVELNLRDRVSNITKQILIPLEPKQLLLKGAILKHTKWIIGFVLYTGSQTKIILNSKKSRVKFSRVERAMSKLLIVILFLQTLLCITCAAVHSSFVKDLTPFWKFFSIEDEDPTFDSFISYFTYLLLLNTMIPISLIITLEIVKIIQGYFIKVDCELYSHVRSKFSKAGSISLNEELGQVNYILSDKTGTLTCNKMQFKFCAIGDCCYEFKKDLPKGIKKLDEILKKNASKQNESASKINDDEDKIRSELNIKPFGPKYMEEFVKSQSHAINYSKFQDYSIKSITNPKCFLDMQDERAIVNEFWKALACAHECVCNENDYTGDLEYSGTSPDDIELVKSAAEQGFKFLKSPTEERKISIGHEETVYPILNILPFSSDRRRMSIIIRDGPLIKLYSKGADSEIKKRIATESRRDFLDIASLCVDKFSSKGYRTLMVSMKVIDEVEYSQWSEKFKQAEIHLVDKQKHMDQCYNEIEDKQYLLGATVVEDKLQDKVPETIRDLRLAGIRIWMLTGDKADTAENIALSCNLISRSQKLFKLKREGEEANFQNQIDRFFSEFSNYLNLSQLNYLAQGYSILIEDAILAYLMKSREVLNQFLEIAMNASAVICCRVNPLQKSLVVKAIKEFDRSATTLAIGDGGNDVSMIMEAHIGIGVYGEEGMRAVQASDFAIGEFKLLRRLLFFHGRTNSIRISEMILYFFFKNFVFTILHFFFAFYNNASGQTIIDDWFISFYNMIFTAFPLGVRAASDFDIKEEDGKVVQQMMPFLFFENRVNPVFTKKSFILSLVRGIIFALINFFTVYVSVNESGINDAGDLGDIWFISLTLFTNIILIVSFRLLITQQYIIIIGPLVMLTTSWAAYFCFAFYVHYHLCYNSTGTMMITFSSGKFFLNLIFVVGTTFTIDLAFRSYGCLFSNSLSGELMVLYKENKLDDLENLPEGIKEGLKNYDLYKEYNMLNANEDVSANMIREADKIDGLDQDEVLKYEFSRHPKSQREAHNKMLNELRLMEEPYNKKFSQEIDTLFKNNSRQHKQHEQSNNSNNKIILDKSDFSHTQDNSAIPHNGPTSHTPLQDNHKLALRDDPDNQ